MKALIRPLLTKQIILGAIEQRIERNYTIRKHWMAKETEKLIVRRTPKTVSLDAYQHKTINDNIKNFSKKTKTWT